MRKTNVAFIFLFLFLVASLNQSGSSNYFPEKFSHISQSCFSSFALSMIKISLGR